MNRECVYPDFTGGMTYGKHNYGKDGDCIICGHTKDKSMNKYKARVRFIFEGIFDVNAKNKLEAYEYVEKHCGLVIGGDIHTSLSDEEIPNWDFCIHPDKKILSIKLR